MKKESSKILTIRPIMMLFAVMACLLVACSGMNETIPPSNTNSDIPILIDADGWKPMTETRATIFENADDFLNDATNGKGGGNFTMHAYLRETGQTFIGGSRAWYFVPDNADNGTWRFYDGTNNRFIQYYWPQNNTVDFFAYMPYKDSGRKKSISVGEYTHGTGLEISCQMQESASLEDTEGQETIIAYTTNKSKADGTVNMHFVHPFAAVYFELKQAHRNLTIDSIRFNNVYLTGRTVLKETTDSSTLVRWDVPTDVNSKTFNIIVGKTIPQDINFGAEIGGPYLVMPQTFSGKDNTNDTNDDVTITVQYTWDDGTDEDKSNDTYKFTRSITTENIKGWEAGHKYRYILNLGDNKEEILFKVEVEPWVPIGEDNNIIDVE